MKISNFTMITTAALAIAACNRSHDQASSEAAAPATDNVALANEAMPAPAAATGAQGFVNAAAASDRFEIESSKLAQASGSSAAVKKFAGTMISAHTDSTAKLKATVSSLNPPLTPDDSLNADQQQMLDGLKGKTGAELDTAYADAQVKAHQATLDTLKAYSASGDNPVLKKFADGLIPTVTAHLNMAKGLK